MEPKNRVFCKAIDRLKILFETESQALNFIKFNADNFKDVKKPKRAYRCSFCDGWHVTSLDYTPKANLKEKHLNSFLENDVNGLSNVNFEISKLKSEFLKLSKSEMSNYLMSKIEEFNNLISLEKDATIIKNLRRLVDTCYVLRKEHNLTVTKASNSEKTMEKLKKEADNYANEYLEWYLKTKK